MKKFSILYQRIFETAPRRGALFQFAIGISVEGYIRYADLILQRCKFICIICINMKTRRRRLHHGGHETVINNDNIKSLVKSYIHKKSDLPHDLKDKPIGEWDVSRVTDMSELFKNQRNFNEDIGGWNVSNVTNMKSMFDHALSFNQPIGQWNVSNVTNMDNMFRQAISFNQPIGNWNVSNVTSMEGMFYRAESFNQPIGQWDVSNVTIMVDMFNNSPFNQPIGNWNVSNVSDMIEMFSYAESFNQPIGNWNVSNVNAMGGIFFRATSFNQNLNNWNITHALDYETLDEIFNESSVDPSNYPIPGAYINFQEDITPDTPDDLKKLGYSKQAIQFILDKQMYDDNFMSYVEDVQNETGIDYNDPIYSTIMIDPVQTSDGKIYERGSIIKIINSRNPISPFTRETLDQSVTPADERRKQINQLINKYLDDKEYERDRPKRAKRHGHLTRKGKLVLEAESHSKTRKSKSKSKSPRNAFDPHAPLPNISHFPSFPHLGSERLASLALKPKTKKQPRSRSASRGGKTRNAKKTMKK
jgi:surface protein